MTATPTPEFAVLFRDFMAERIRDEHTCTVRVLAELHDGDWRPDPKSRSARELAWHLASSERWFVSSAASRKFEGGQDGPLPATLAEIISYYDSAWEADLARLSALTGEQLLEVTDFFGMQVPLYTLLNFAQIHTIHHRAQLSNYLRPLRRQGARHLWRKRRQSLGRLGVAQRKRLRMNGAAHSIALS